MTVFTEFAPAKINLTLEVLGKRPDGYHEIQSLVAFARDAGDVVTLDTLRPVGSDVTGPFGATIAGKNLIDVTLVKLAAADPRLRLGYVTLTKNLPVAAGIGGGSADAAALLRAVRRANPDIAASVDWHTIARGLGADVPVCVQRCLSWITGAGEHVEPIRLSPPLVLHAVVANPLVPVPPDKTAQVFRALQTKPLAIDFNSSPPPTWQDDSAGVFQFIRAGSNDLESAALAVVRKIAVVLRELRESPKCLLARMSGGGPTCFAIFETADAAESARAILAAARPAWWVVKTELG